MDTAISKRQTCIAAKRWTKIFKDMKNSIKLTLPKRIE